MEKEGVLFKQGLVFRQWHARYCVVCPASVELVYMEKRRNPVRGRIRLHKALVRDKGNATMHGKTMHVFALMTPRTSFKMAVATLQDKQEWMHAIQLVSQLGHALHRASSPSRQLSTSPSSDRSRRRSSAFEGAMGDLIQQCDAAEQDTQATLHILEQHMRDVEAQLASVWDPLELQFESLIEHESDLLEAEEVQRIRMVSLSTQLGSLERFCRASTKLQYAVVSLIESEGYTAAVEHLRGSASEAAASMLQLFEACGLSDSRDTTPVDALQAYNEYLCTVHLPKSAVLDSLKAQRFTLWRELVAIVKERHDVETQRIELGVMASHVEARTAADVLPEDTPDLFRQDWDCIAHLLHHLAQLQHSRSVAQQQLAETRQRRHSIREYRSEAAISV